MERPFFYLEQHFVKGGEWVSFEDFALCLARFADELDHLVHGTTQEEPRVRFLKEEERLTALPAAPFGPSVQESRKVSWDCLISFAGSRYSVPWQQAGQRVWLRLSQGRKLIVCAADGSEIACHPLSQCRGTSVIVPAHYQGLSRGLPKTWLFLEHLFLKQFPDCQWFLDGLGAQQYAKRAAPLRAILELAEIYPPQRLRSSFALARQYNRYSPTFVRRLLESPAALEAATPAAALWPRPVSGVGADLGAYQRLLEASR